MGGGLRNAEHSEVVGAPAEIVVVFGSLRRTERGVEGGGKKVRRIERRRQAALERSAPRGRLGMTNPDASKRINTTFRRRRDQGSQVAPHREKVPDEAGQSLWSHPRGGARDADLSQLNP